MILFKSSSPASSKCYKGSIFSTSVPLPDEALVAAHLSLESLHKNGHQKIEEYIIAKCHESYKVEGSPWRGGGHAIIEYNIPVLLG